jgi:uncharacterized membrane protein YqjE
MSITTTTGRILSTIVAMLHTRLDLISVEIEEELLRFSSYFMAALIALFCGGITIASLLLLVLVLFWEQHRIAVLVSFITVFGVIGVMTMLWLRVQIANKPPLLEQSMAEFKKDTEMLSAAKSESDLSGEGLS